MSYDSLRRNFLNYFVQLNHKECPSSSLIPGSDSTLMFTNSGMNQFIESFLGIETPVAPCVTTVQRCVRAGGKHNDLENVGYTARHHTFFEMLGNFSFGSYFKKQAIEYAWIFVTQHLNLPIDRLWITVHHQDEESESLWHNHIGVPMDRIVRCSDKDNFWAMGDRGPCGPCTEIFYDLGPSVPGGPPGSTDSDGDRYMEIWNLVFMQYDRQVDGSFLPLPRPCVDTGMGLERLACISEGVLSNFDTSLFRNLKKPLAQRTKASLNDPRLNVIADHLRAATFIIADGMTPSSEGRGYVLRRLIRRALSHGYKLGLKTPFLFEYVPHILEEMGGAYPFLRAQQGLCRDVMAQEEQLFYRTLQGGLKYVQKALDCNHKIIKGSDLFKLYDTYGFPIDIARDIAMENHRELDQTGFEECMQRQKIQSKGECQQKKWTISELPTIPQTFWRDICEISSKILSIHADLDPSKSWICLENTPFYAESGGQIGDTGTLTYLESSIEVLDTQKALHLSMVLTGVPVEYWTLGSLVTATLDSTRRHQIACHHTATHLLHAALHKTLSPAVRQRGSHVGSERLRFDISYHKPLTNEQISNLESYCQEQIDKNLEVTTALMSQEEAIASGAIAFFGEKYSSEVRVLSIGQDVSKELCGGTHIPQLNSLMTVLILSDEPLSSGVRRIHAVAGPAALNWLKDRSMVLSDVESKLRIASSQVVKVLSDLQIQHHDLMKSLENLRKARLLDKLRSKKPQIIGDNPVLILRLESEEKAYFNEAVDFLNALPDFRDRSSVTICLWVKEDRTHTLLLTQFGQPSLTLDSIGDSLKKKWNLKGGGRTNRIQLGGSFEGNLESFLLELLLPDVRDLNQES